MKRLMTITILTLGLLASFAWLNLGRGVKAKGTATAITNPPIVVTTLVDEDDGTADPGLGAGTSLREAINAANAADGDDEINFAVTGTINLTSGLPLLNSNIKITGPGASALTVRAALSNIVIFWVQDFDSPVTVAVTIAGMTLSDGVVGVKNLGTLELINCTITATSITGVSNLGTLEVINCTITGSNGGGIRNFVGGVAKVTNSTITGNHGEQGGGIYNEGTLEVTDSTISNNNADEDGGGIYGGALTMTNCTVSGNSAKRGGGIFNQFGNLKMTNCTVSGNSASFGGGGLFGPLLEFQNTIIALNTAPNGPDVWTGGGFVTSLGHNLIGKGDGSAGFTNGVNGDQVGTTASPVNPGLELDSFGKPLLKDNGGPTKTIALLCSSPAIDHGDNSVLNAPLSLTTDQRGAGFNRSRDGNGDSVATVDIGAFEAQSPAPLCYNFSGFFQPVDNLPTVNVAKAGSAIPVKFSLGGNRGLNIFAPGYPVSQQIACSSGAPQSLIEETVTAGSSSLSYDAGSDTYTYVWKTNSVWKNTCRKLIVKLNDGSTHVANFSFK